MLLTVHISTRHLLWKTFFKTVCTNQDRVTESVWRNQDRVTVSYMSLLALPHFY